MRPLKFTDKAVKKNTKMKYLQKNKEWFTKYQEKLSKHKKRICIICGEEFVVKYSKTREYCDICQPTIATIRDTAKKTRKSRLEFHDYLIYHGLNVESDTYEYFMNLYKKHHDK